MHLSLRHASPVVTVLAFLALGALAISLLIVEVAVVSSAGPMAAEYPEFTHLAGPLIVAAIAWGVCIMAVLVITALLIGTIDRGRIFDPRALRLVDALVAALVLAAAILGGVLTVIPGPPALALGLFGGALVGVALALVVLRLRALLRHAASMRFELDEVI